MLGLLPFDRALMIIVPLALFTASRLVQASFRVLWPNVLLVMMWVGFVIIASLLVAPRSPWPVVGVVGGVVVMQSVFELIPSAIAGPAATWVAVWDSVPLRLALFTIALTFIAWTLVATGGALKTQLGKRTSTGVVMISAGLVVAGAAAIVGFVGPDRFGALWQDNVVTVDLPNAVIWIPVVGGIVIAFIGGFLRNAGRR